MIRTTISLMMAALSIVAVGLTPDAALAASFSGSFPVSIVLPPQFAHTGCLTLVDDGTGGQHSGSASLSGPMVGGQTLTGTFQVINHLFVATLESGSYTGEVVYELFIAPANDGDLIKGVYEEPGFLSGALTFGEEGGC
jgi:hypothetical protein